MEKHGNTDFFELTNWIEKEIMNYDDDQKLNKPSCQCLRGLSNGKVMGSYNAFGESNYPYDIILTAFKVNKIKILNAIRGKTFSTELGKIKYISAIVEKDLNDVYTRVKNARKAHEKAEKADVDAIIATNTAQYKKKESNPSTIDKFKDIW